MKRTPCKHHLFSIIKWVLTPFAIKPILFQTSLIAPQVFREDRRQILRAIYQNSDYIEFSPKYIPVIDSDLEELSFQLTDKNNKDVDILPGHVNFVLHFRRCNRA